MMNAILKVAIKSDKFKLLEEQLVKQKESLIESASCLLRDALADFMFEEDDLVDIFFQTNTEDEIFFNQSAREKYRDMQHDMIQEILDKVLV